MPKKKSKAPPAGSQGLLSPVVLAAKGVVGDSEINKLRAEIISKHADVIGTFCETGKTTEFGRDVLRILFQLADRDGNGTICLNELQFALVEVLGFRFLKEKQIKGIFARADVDGNGVIDYDEWEKSAPKTLKVNLTKLAKTNGHDMGLLA